MIHQQILDMRESRGIRRAFVAKKLGVSVSTVHYWETGDRCPSVENLSKLVNLYRATDSEIVGLFRQ